ncbi:hypothetical protein [Acinetobacter sp. ANC 4648]|uniref:hypothetical protein n=1 Tax=Acinetobacter sp. ANC 4648 TaxID=1977875 RepID=UPI000A34E4D4|nr:hypothetical protein [Acinetobacter sp. ANC 4648]OTG80650.1 hypothetical protein B9T27_12315 [Acinetobacter sp. ANC 4648]
MFLMLGRVGSLRIGCLSLCLSFLLSACGQQQQDFTMDSEPSDDDSQTSTATLQADQESIVSGTFDEGEDQGKKLTDVAGQASIPMLGNQRSSHKSSQLSEQQLKYVGRYSTQINCSDHFVDCEKGTVEYILNLLPDGTAHRTIVYSGRMHLDTDNQGNTIQPYRKDTWSYENNEIVIHLAEGAEFYYTIDEQQNLVMNLEKILESNKRKNHVFANKDSIPDQAYVLMKSKS